MIALGEVEQVIPDCLSGAGGEASFQDDAERAIEISQTLTVAEGITHHPHPIGIDLQSSQGRSVFWGCSYCHAKNYPITVYPYQ